MKNNTAITTASAPPSALALMASRVSCDPVKLHATLRSTVFKGSTDEELLALVIIANTYQLNPILREMYAFPKRGGGMVPMVSIDGWIKIANRDPNYDGMNVVVFGDGDKPTHATCEIFLKNRAHPVEITEYFSECYRKSEPWDQMPRRMLRNKAIIQAIRVAFGVSGIFDEDESHSMRDITPAPAPVAAKRNPFRTTAPIPTLPEIEPEPETTIVEEEGAQ